MNILELSALLQEGLNMSSTFFAKIEDCVLNGCNFIKTLVHNRFFPHNILFKAASFQYIFQKKMNLWWVLFIAKLQSEHCNNFIIDFFLRNFKKLLPSVIFRYILIYEEANYMKDYIKARQRKARKGPTLRLFYAECFLTPNTC